MYPIFMNYIYLIFVSIGLVASQEHAKARRTYRTRPTQRVPEEISEADDDTEDSDKCPEPDGFFADAEQCDKYYACK